MAPKLLDSPVDDECLDVSHVPADRFYVLLSVHADTTTVHLHCSANESTQPFECVSLSLHCSAPWVDCFTFNVQKKLIFIVGQ